MTDTGHPNFGGPDHISGGIVVNGCPEIDGDAGTAGPETERKPMAKKTTTKASDTQAFEKQLWEACEAQRGSVNASRYKHPVLGLVFLKYVNDNFEHHRGELERRLADPSDEYYLDDQMARLDVLEDRDEYTAANVFWIPAEARWTEIRDNAAQADIATRIDKVMDAIERENDILRGVLPKSFASSEIPNRNLKALIEIVDGITFGGDEADGRDKLGQVYEYFLGKFSGIEGRAGEDYTPRSVVDLLVEMLEPYKGRIYDPCCGSGGMFVQSRKFLDAHGGKGSDIAVYGQESNPETWRLCKMNLALHGIEGDLADRADSSFTADLHPDLRADFIITNPPFNLGEKGGTGWGRDQLMEDARWKVGGTTVLPPASNANFAWILHFLYHLSPTGYAGFVLANGALSNVNRSEEVTIRKALVEAGIVDCIVTLPTKLFANTQIPVSLWFMSNNRGETKQHRARQDETLFIDARKLGHLISRRQRELSREVIERIASTYHAFRNNNPTTPYEDIEGFCKVAKRADIAAQGYVLTSGRYVGTESADEDELPTAERLELVRTQLLEELDKSAEIEKRLRDLLGRVTGDE
jgi:type I restriction enzyme M protein